MASAFHLEMLSAIETAIRELTPFMGQDMESYKINEREYTRAELDKKWDSLWRQHDSLSTKLNIGRTIGPRPATALRPGRVCG